MSDQQWPKLDHAAMYGLAGEIVTALAPHTESDPTALLVDLLTTFGAMVGPGPHSSVERTKHPARLFSVVVGDTAKGRKGASRKNIEAIQRHAEHGWLEGHQVGGLSTGEGLILAVSDEEDDEGNKIYKDKSKLVYEPELGRILAANSRESNNLSQVIRQCWDGDDLYVTTRSRPLKATGAHVCIISHITKPELLLRLPTVDLFNGFANRFLWVCSRRSQMLPSGGTISDTELTYLGMELGVAVDKAKGIGRMFRTPEADALWSEAYHSFNEDTVASPGVDALLQRAEAQALRLSVTYALLDASPSIDVEHLEAAVAMWKYCEASVLYLFGDASTGNAKADRLLAALRETEGMTRYDVNRFFSSNVPSKELDAIETLLISLGLIRARRIKTKGRPKRVISVVE